MKSIMTHLSAFLETKIICTKITNVDLGLPEEEMWQRIVIDLREIIAIRETGDEDGEDQVVLYSKCDNWCVAGNYELIIEQWKALIKNL